MGCCSCSSQVVAKAFPMGSFLYSPSPLPSEPVPLWQRVRQLCQQAFDVCTHQLIGLGSSPHLLYIRSKETHVEATLSVDTREGKWWGPWGNVGKIDQAADPSNPITEIWACCSLPFLLAQKLSSEPDCSVLERGQLVLWISAKWQYTGDAGGSARSRKSFWIDTPWINYIPERHMHAVFFLAFSTYGHCVWLYVCVVFPECSLAVCRWFIQLFQSYLIVPSW